MATKKPAYYAYAVVLGSQDENGNDRSYWIKVGAAFSNKDGGYTVLMDALPVDGKLILRAPDSQGSEESDDQPRNRRYRR
jgi:hypothetical protein